jgi:hypothetical protein
LLINIAGFLLPSTLDYEQRAKCRVDMASPEGGMDRFLIGGNAIGAHASVSL